MDSLGVNIADLAVAVVLLLSALLAFARGFVHEVFSVAGWIGAIFATIYAMPLVKPRAVEWMKGIPKLPDWVSPDTVAPFVAGTLIFVVTLVVLALLTRIVSRTIQSSAFNALDRALGFLFGLARGAVVVCLAYIAVDWMYGPEPQAAEGNQPPAAGEEPAPDTGKPQWLLSAKSLPLIQSGADFLVSLAPEGTIANGAKAIGGAKDRAASEAEKRLRGMITTTPKNPALAPLEGYEKTIRKGLDKAIESIK